MQKITTFLMFNDQAEEAVNFYTSVFQNSKVVNVLRNDGDMPGPKGGVVGATFELDGQQFIAFNGGPQFSFSQGMSLFVNCKDQAEVDRLWETLSEGGEKQMCGWLKDKYGVSWQIIPDVLFGMLTDSDSSKAHRVMEALLKMTKIDMKTLEMAYEGVGARS